MKYLIILFLLIGCSYNSKQDNSVSNISLLNKTDSLYSMALTINESGFQLDTTAKEILNDVQDKVNELHELKKQLHNKSQPTQQYTSQNNSGYDRLISELRKQIIELENEINYYKYHTSSKPPYTIKTEEKKVDQVITPDYESLIVKLNSGKLKVPDWVDVYLLPYNKKSRKLKIYETYCDLSQINKIVGFTKAYKNNGIYFFNSVQQGKYLIKICAYYGGYKVCEKKPGKQIEEIEFSPPIQ